MKKVFHYFLTAFFLIFFFGILAVPVDHVFASTVNWVGASNGSWGTASNWDVGQVPSSTSDVVIASSTVMTVLATSTINFSTLTIGGGAASSTLSLSGVIGSGVGVTLASKGILSQATTTAQTITGDFLIQSGGLLTHAINGTAQTSTINFSANNFTLDSGGSINVDGKGYASTATGNGNGPGGGGGDAYQSSVAAGAGHGGNGGNGGYTYFGAALVGGNGYCDVSNPSTIGSSGGGSYWFGTFGSSGGGLIQLSVAGTATINGAISARGTTAVASAVGAGAGGGVKLAAGTVAGTPQSFSVAGGSGTNSGNGGGGGCVLLDYTTSNSVSSTASYFSVSGSTGAGAGVAYFKQAGQAGALYAINAAAGTETNQGASTLTVDTLVLRNATYSVSSTKNIVINNASPFSGGSTGTLKIYNTASTTINASGALDTAGISITVLQGGLLHGASISALTIPTSSVITFNSTSTIDFPLTTINLQGGSLTFNANTSLPNFAVANLNLAGGTFTANTSTVLNFPITSLNVNGSSTVQLGNNVAFSTTISDIIINNGYLRFNANTVFSSTTLSTITVGNSTNTSTLEMSNFTTTTAFQVGAVVVNNKGTITHTANTTTQAHVLNLSANTITINTGGSINVDGKGYAGNSSGSGKGPGGGPRGAGQSQVAAGAGHGGNGGNGLTFVGGLGYCDISNPSTIGSAGGDNNLYWGTFGSAGGGLIQLAITGTATINGTISARGATSTANGSGAGSGGGIKLVADTIAGTPQTFSVAGGSATNNGGGGGGCTLLNYTTSNSVSSTASYFSVSGSTGAGAGLAYFKQTNQVGTLYAINAAAGTETNQVVDTLTVDTLVLRNATYSVSSTKNIVINNSSPFSSSSTGTLKIYNTASTTINASGVLDTTGISITVLQGGLLHGASISTLTIPTSSVITFNSTSTIDFPLTTINLTGGMLDLNPNMSLSNFAISNLNLSGGTMTVATGTTLNFPITSLALNSSTTLTLGSNVNFSQTLTSVAVNYGYLTVRAGDVFTSTTLTSLTVGNGTNTSTLEMGYFTTTTAFSQAASIVVNNKGTITHTANTTTQAHVLNLSADTITINTGGSINADAKGYAGVVRYNGSGPGGGTGDSFQSQTAGGGGHGGIGGAGTPSSTFLGGAAYASPTNPLTIGSSGGGSWWWGAAGGAGGGLVILNTTGTTTINGTLSVKGGTGGNLTGNGAGGAVKITASIVTGTPQLFSAAGGSGGGGGGGGGGGSVLITYTTSNSVSSTISYFSIAGGTGANTGAIGTYVFSQSNSAPTLAALLLTTLTNGSGNITISVQASDTDANEVKLKTEYKLGTCAAYSGQVTSTILSAVSSTYFSGDIVVANSADDGFQMTTVKTASGANTVEYTWDSRTDLSTGDGQYCIFVTPNDGTVNGTTVSSTITVDNVAPTAPGSLSVVNTSTQSMTLAFGSVSSDTNFSEYKVFYKAGSSQATQSDIAYTSTSDSNLGVVNFNAAPSVAIAGLATSTQYVFNIWAYDTYGNVATATTEIAEYTLAAVAGSPVVVVSSTTSTVLRVSVDQASNPSTVTYSFCKSADGVSCDSSGYVQADGSFGASPVWQSYATWGSASGVDVNGLSPNTSYVFLTTARNPNAITTANSSPNTGVYTLANAPSVLSAGSAKTSLVVSWESDNNPASTEYYAFNTTASSTSDWGTPLTWASNGLRCRSSYDFIVKARNGDGVETSDVAGSFGTTACSIGGYSPPLSPGPVDTTATTTALLVTTTPVLILLPVVTSTPSTAATMTTTPSNIAATIGTGVGAGTGVVSSLRFTRTLAPGKKTDVEILYLQQLLNRLNLIVSPSGPGSKGKETDFFGRGTLNALIRFQRVNRLRQTGKTDVPTRFLLNKFWKEQFVGQLTEPEELVKEVKIIQTDFFTKNLSTGMVDPQVMKLQQTLNALGFVVAKSGPGSKGNETKRFGALTRKALRNYQKYHKLPQTGVVDEKTRKALNDVVKA